MRTSLSCSIRKSEAKRDRESLLRDLYVARQALASRKRTAKEPVVSSHALLRDVERVLGIDVKALSLSPLSQEAKETIRAGATHVTVDGVSLVVKDNVIVTVVDWTPRKTVALPAFW